jgi:hypothetical protein
MIINTIDELKDLAIQGVECYIALNFGLKSIKHITYIEDAEVFEVINYIDESEQILTEKDLFDEEYTNIGKALNLKALYVNI